MFLDVQIISVFICLILGGLLKTPEEADTFEGKGTFAAQAQRCEGLLHADNGEIEIQPSKSNCVWIIKLKSTTGISLELKEFTTEPITVIPALKNSRTNFQSNWMIGPEATYKFEGKIFAILAAPRDQKASLRWTGLTVDHSDVTLSAKFERSLEGSLEWEQKFVGVDTTVWAVGPEGTGKFNWEMTSDLSHCGQDSTCACISFGVIHVMPDGRIRNIHKSCNGSSVGSWKVEKNSLIVLIFMDSAVAEGSSKLQVKWTHEQEPPKRITTGIVVGTEGGLCVVALNPRKKIKFSSKWVRGVAFDWNSEKIYWAEKGVGIMRANVDGSDFQQLIADEYAVGVGIESITGNLYYGSISRNSLRVCNNDGTRCSSIIRFSGIIWDIALHPIKGLLFWSVKDSVIMRANLDGSNVTEVVTQKSWGISVDESEDRVYTLIRRRNETISFDLNGRDLRTLRKFSIDPIDLQMDGDKLYYSGYHSKSLHSIAQGDTSPTLIAKFAKPTRYIALFGERLAPAQPNPCEKAKCSHLCVLNSKSLYRYLCPDGKKLRVDGTSCGI